VVAGAEGERVTLEVWSLEEGKSLGRLETSTARGQTLTTAVQTWIDVHCELRLRVRGYHDTIHAKFNTRSNRSAANAYLSIDEERGKVQAAATAPDLSVVHSPSGRWPPVKMAAGRCGAARPGQPGGCRRPARPARLWDARSGRCIRTFLRHRFRAFDPTGRFLAALDRQAGEVAV
jgi:hypothetical protein